MQNSWQHFENYLKGFPIPEKAQSFYVFWVRKALSWMLNEKDIHQQPPLKPISENIKKRFIKFLETRYEPWQVAQAEEAIKLYNYFFSISQKSSEEPAEAAWAYIIEEARRLMRLRQLSYRTEKTYLSWIERFQQYTNARSPARLTAGDFQDFLTHLAVERCVAPSTQNQALNALVFLYKHLLQQDITAAIDAVRARERRRLPVVLEREEMKKLVDPLWEHLQKVRQLYEFDREEDLPGVHFPGALARKYPNAGKEWVWYWLFPSPNFPFC